MGAGHPDMSATMPPKCGSMLRTRITITGFRSVSRPGCYLQWHLREAEQETYGHRSSPLHLATTSSSTRPAPERLLLACRYRSTRSDPIGLKYLKICNRTIWPDHGAATRASIEYTSGCRGTANRQNNVTERFHAPVWCDDRSRLEVSPRDYPPSIPRIRPEVPAHANSHLPQEPP